MELHEALSVAQLMRIIWAKFVTQNKTNFMV
jgi:hypothetical protein